MTRVVWVCCPRCGQVPQPVWQQHCKHRGWCSASEPEVSPCARSPALMCTSATWPIILLTGVVQWGWYWQNPGPRWQQHIIHRGWHTTSEPDVSPSSCALCTRESAMRTLTMVVLVCGCAGRDLYLNGNNMAAIGTDVLPKSLTWVPPVFLRLVHSGIRAPDKEVWMCEVLTGTYT